MLAGAVSEGVCYSSRCSGGKCQALKERYDGESATLSSSGRACKIVLFATLALIALFKRKEHLVFAMCCILTNASVMFLDFLLISSEIMLKKTTTVRSVSEAHYAMQNTKHDREQTAFIA